MSYKSLIVASTIWFLPVVFFFPFWGIISGIFITSVVIFFIGKLSEQKIGGITGDILGAIAFTAESVFLLGVVIYLRYPF